MSLPTPPVHPHNYSNNHDCLDILHGVLLGARVGRRPGVTAAGAGMGGF
jgi:hypothetical protein